MRLLSDPTKRADMEPNLAQRSVRSVQWTLFGSVIGVGLSFIQVVILSRLLPVEVFGIYAIATSVILLIMSNANFGMGSALIHRAPETEDIQQAIAIHFTLKLIITLALSALILAGIFIFTDHANTDLRLALVVITLAETVTHLTQTPQVILSRQVRYRRLAIIDMANKALTAVISVGMALGGATLWALLISNIITALVSVIGLYVWKPIWLPTFAWDRKTVRYLLTYGSRTTAASWLMKALDNVDDLWTGVFLGAQAVGFYARAYRFARYPAYLVASPISVVASGTYAELKGERETLSIAFLQTNALVVRTGFLLAGVIAIIAPAFITLVLGEKWLPMLDAFRLMLIYALFEPMKSTISMLYLGVGRPDLLVRFRLVQLIVLIGGLFVLGLPLGIAGVALAVDLMLIVGIVLMLWNARQFVDYSHRRLLLGPLSALGFALLAAITLDAGLLAETSLLWRNVITAAVFVLIYIIGLLLWDRQQIRDLWFITTKHLRT